MLVTTTDNVQDHKVVAYLGIVSGEAIMGTNLFKDFFASIRDVVGGRAGAYEKSLREAKELALTQMKEEAQLLGAHAVLAVDLDYEVIGGDDKTMLMVSANGTAVKLG
ncbi:MAG: YbjQ family protein [Rhodospirillaceae bacterium]|nr:YbjQ family protein [Rhodospirillaceae bacterium]